MHLLVHSLLLQPLQNMLKYIPSERQEVLKARGVTRSSVYKSGVTSGPIVACSSFIRPLPLLMRAGHSSSQVSTILLWVSFR